MPEPSFIPDNYLARLSKRLIAPDHKEALDKLSVDFGDPRFLARHYVQPHCQLTDPAHDQDGERRPAFTMLNAFLAGGGGSREGERNGRRTCLFLLGDAGTGKTSLLLMLRLAYLTGLWPSYYRCELMKLGPSTLESIGALKTPRKTVLLLDALNEDAEASPGKVDGRVIQILEATRDVHRVIVSCRTSYFPDGRHEAFGRVGEFASAGLGCARIFLSLFNHTQMDKYLKRRFQRMKEPNRKRAKSVLETMGSLRGRPLLLNHIDDFVHSRCKSWNEYSSYEALIDAWFDREQRRIGSAGTGGKFDIATMRGTCIKMARLMQMSASRCLVSKSELAEPDAFEADEIIQLELLECQSRSLLRRNKAGSYRFTHASIQEFFIALGIRTGALPAGKQRIPATDLIIGFLLLCDDANTEWRALDLTHSSFAGVKLHAADFSRSLLVSADLAGGNFHTANFDHALLPSCEARGADFYQGSFESTKASNASWRSAAFSASRFANSILAGSILAEATFDACEFDHTLLADCNLAATSFTKTTINDCSFKSSQLCNAEFHDSALTKVRFDRCSLTNTRFINTSLQDVSLQSADLRSAKLDDAFLEAVRGGAVRNWKTAAWDPEVAHTLKLSSKENNKNADTIDRHRRP